MARRLRWDVHTLVARAWNGNDPQTPAYFDELTLADGKAFSIDGTLYAEPQDSVPLSSERNVISSETKGLMPRAEVWECEECPQLVIVGKGLLERKADTDKITSVAIAEPFAIGITDVTVGEFRAFLTSQDSDKKCGTHPVCDRRKQKIQYPANFVSWDEAIEYVGWLNKRLELSRENAKNGYYRLPTEAEWEYAALGGSRGPYTFGSDPKLLCQYGNGADQELYQNMLANLACSDGVGRGRAPVKKYKPNEFGLYDVHGNVMQWVGSCWVDAGGGVPDNTQTPGSCKSQKYVVKGSSWLGSEDAQRLTSRTGFSHDHKRTTLGFRVVRVLPTKQ